MGVTYINPYRFAAFSPLDLSPALWLDASDTSTITQSGGAVSQWNDKSGNGRNVVQATAANQPSTGTATQNGLNVLTFAGDFMTSSSAASTWKFLHDGTDYLIVAVVKFGTSANPNTYYGLVGTNIRTADVGFWCYYGDADGLNDMMSHGVTRGVTGTYSVVNNSANGALTSNAFHVVSVFGDPDDSTASARSSLNIDGGSGVTNNTQTGSVSASNPTNTLAIGGTGSAAPNMFPLTGAVAEIVIVSGANATDANRVALRDYLNTKWAVY